MNPDEPTPAVTHVGSGVKQVSVGAPFRSHVYLIDGPDGPVAFDAGLKDTGSAILAAAGGRLDRVILSHAHVDHRGGASELGAPVYCHPDEVADAEGDAGRSYTDFSLIENEQVRELVPRLHGAWDGGPVEIAGTIADGDVIAASLQVPGFRIPSATGTRRWRASPSAGSCHSKRTACGLATPSRCWARTSPGNSNGQPSLK